MKKFCRLLNVIIICIILFFTSNVSFLKASEVSQQITDYENIIIGHADSEALTRDNLLPNWLIIDFDATATSINIKFTNIALDSIDSVSAIVTVGNVSKSILPFRAGIGTTEKTVNIDMKRCHETIKVYTTAKDGGDDIGTSTTTGSRDMPSILLDLWHQGSFPSVSDSLNYHFEEHASSMGISNIVSYVNSAQGFRGNLKGATTSIVTGPTPNVTRYKKNGRYIDIQGSKNVGKIVSYGKQ